MKRVLLVLVASLLATASACARQVPAELPLARPFHHSGFGLLELGPAVQVSTYARLPFHPVGVAVDRAGNVYVADTGNLRIARIDPAATSRPLPA